MKYSAERLLQSVNGDEPILTSPFLITTQSRLLQEENALLPMVVKLPGSDSLVSPLHFSNACMVIVFTPSGIMTAVRS